MQFCVIVKFRLTQVTWAFLTRRLDKKSNNKVMNKEIDNFLVVVEVHVKQIH